MLLSFQVYNIEVHNFYMLLYSRSSSFNEEADIHKSNTKTESGKKIECMQATDLLFIH